MDINNLMSHCTVCPRECGADRLKGKGFCGESRDVRISRAELHMWEEPCISGTKGSGTVFFSGCTLRCCFCQNYEISHQGKGFSITENELADTFIRLQSMGAHNINLVNPTHFVPQIIKAIDIAGNDLKIPIVYNTGGYEKIETLEILGSRVKIFLPDLKYYDREISKKYSAAENYFEKAISSIHKMVEIAGRPDIENGLMKSGVIVRHMILPSHRQDSIKLIDILSREFSADEIMVSLMCQYTPVYKAEDYKEINRKLSSFEYRTVSEALERSGFDGFVQQRDSASDEFIPVFYDKKYY